MKKIIKRLLKINYLSTYASVVTVVTVVTVVAVVTLMTVVTVVTRKFCIHLREIYKKKCHVIYKLNMESS